MFCKHHVPWRLYNTKIGSVVLIVRYSVFRTSLATAGTILNIAAKSSTIFSNISRLLSDVSLSVLELHGPGSTSSAFMFHGNNQIMSFHVPDMSAALDIIYESGFKLLSEVIPYGEGFLFCYI